MVAKRGFEEARVIECWCRGDSASVRGQRLALSFRLYIIPYCLYIQV